MSSKRTTDKQVEEENPLQFFRTPPWVTWNLLRWRGSFFAGKRVLELGCGDGWIAKELLAWGSPAANGFDGYQGIELDRGRARTCREVVRKAAEEATGRGRGRWNSRPPKQRWAHVDVGNVQHYIPPAAAAGPNGFEVIIFNPPFNQAEMFILRAAQLLAPGGRYYMLQRSTFPCAPSLGRAKFFFDEHAADPVAEFGHRGKLDNEDRIDFIGDGKSDSIPHAWFEWEPGHSGALPTWEVMRKAACPWDPNREPKIPRRGTPPPKQQGLFQAP